jgi:hypothetical protein
LSDFALQYTRRKNPVRRSLSQLFLQTATRRIAVVFPYSRTATATRGSGRACLRSFSPELRRGRNLPLYGHAFGFGGTQKSASNISVKFGTDRPALAARGLAGSPGHTTHLHQPPLATCGWRPINHAKGIAINARNRRTTTMDHYSKEPIKISGHEIL